jgi:predicted XRE-type DNA-binding protein
MKRKTEKLPRITRGSGNVFADLGFNHREAAELQLKAELVRQIYNRVKALNLTQVQAAARLGLSQPDVSKLMNARLTGYSSDRLIALLNALDVDVDIVIRPRKIGSRQKPGTVSVRQARGAA